MRFFRFIKDKRLLLAITLAAGFMGGFAMYAFGCPAPFIVMTVNFYLFGVFTALAHEYIKKRGYYNNLLSNLDSLDKKYYLSDVMEQTQAQAQEAFCEAELLEEILKITNKSMNDEIAAYARAKRDYRTYVEMWVHEIKTPISGARLICENNGYDDVLTKLDEVEKYVEQSLFYARSEAVEKDFLIREIPINDLINNVVKKNAGVLIARRVKIEINVATGTVYTDPKWLEFILQQLLDNSIKYGSKTIVFTYGSQSLAVGDDGIGIPSADLPRIFDYGFTGENGRKTAKSTGIGLFLCKRLCDKLGLEITADSTNGTVFTISFPQNPYVTFS